MSSSAVILTIDGPAASGKSSVSRAVARQLGWSWVSTGAFYRGLAYVALVKKLNLDDEAEMAKLAVSPLWSVRMSEEQTLVILDGKDVTEMIYAEEVGSIASKISHYPKVRQALLQAQRDCASGVKGLVAEGRDCGTVVFPQAKFKVFLTARSENRAQRRAKEQGRDVKETHQAQQQRDLQDSSRKVAPMQVPPGAEVIDTSELNLEQVISAVLAILSRSSARPSL